MTSGLRLRRDVTVSQLTAAMAVVAELVRLGASLDGIAQMPPPEVHDLFEEVPAPREATPEPNVAKCDRCGGIVVSTTDGLGHSSRSCMHCGYGFGSISGKRGVLDGVNPSCRKAEPTRLETPHPHASSPEPEEWECPKCARGGDGDSPQFCPIKDCPVAKTAAFLTPDSAGVSRGGEAATSEPTYPCRRCGKLRTKDEGGTTFTVCDECWDADRVARPSPSGRDAEVFQGDVTELLSAVGLGLYARPYSAHETVQREVLPEIARLTTDLATERADVARLRAALAQGEQDRERFAKVLPAAVAVINEWRETGDPDFVVVPTMTAHTLAAVCVHAARSASPAPREEAPEC